MTKKILFLSLLALSLSSCQNGEPPSSSLPSSTNPSSEISSTSSSSSPSETISSPSSTTPEETSSLKESLLVLRDEKNYTWTLTVSSETFPESDFLTFYFTENVLGYTSLEDESYTNLYIDDGEGVYPLNSFEGQLLSGEYLKKADGTLYDTAWTDDIQPSLFGKDFSFLDEVENTDTTCTISDKAFRINMLNVLRYSSADILDMSAIVCTIDEEGLTMAFTLGEMSIAIAVRDIGTTTIPIYERFLAQGGSVYVPNTDLSEFRRLIQGSNFINTMDNGDTILYEVFNPNYFFSSVSGSGYCDGYVALDDPESGYYGCYMAMVEGEPTSTSAESVSGQISILGNLAIYEEPDIPGMYHYPSFLQLLTNLQFLLPGVDATLENVVEPKGSCYTLTEYTLLEDFATNFSIDQSYPLDTYLPYALSVDIQLSEEDALSAIDFYYVFAYTNDGVNFQASYLQYHYSGFGKANIPNLDKVVANPGQYL